MGTVGIYIQYVLHSLVLIFMISCFLHVFDISNIFRKHNFCFAMGRGGGVVKKIVCKIHKAKYIRVPGLREQVMLASEPVGGRSRATELPCSFSVCSYPYSIKI